MSAAEIRDALIGRWPADKHVHIHEAPEGQDRQGRRLDALVVSTWKSRGLAIDGVEIKISMSDWKRELDNPDKADFWWQHCDRFWIAAPTEVAKKIKPQLPVGWGLLACDTKTRVLVEPTKNEDRQPIPWATMVGLLRAAADTSSAILARTHRTGYDEGRRSVLDEVGPVNGDPAQAAKLREVERNLDRLRASVDAFEQGSGLTIGGGWQGRRIGEAVAVLLAAQDAGPGRFDANLSAAVRDARAAADLLDALRSGVAAALVPPAVEQLTLGASR